MRKIIKYLMLSFVIVISIGCSKSDMTVYQAARELPFPVLLPDPLPEGWEINETVFDDDLLVLSYKTENDGRVDLVQDLNIQGLDILALQTHVIVEGLNTTSSFPDESYTEIGGFIGELNRFVEPVPIVQYTFVNKDDLFNANDNIPLYQAIGKQASEVEVRKLVESLELIEE
ncbi:MULTISPECIES: hypothetical protein [Bacillaceae]|uniref:DUF4245 domain-containing protein n=1 Tax=Evansella alkalicola TaxID=745819 RepID=A0ABS6JUP5_9BACI|nr:MULTISPECIES: hypothetical protein [Bacillaceae]MBU9720855.1 DUF4245 domain-containing protein [Bacillus alkalicola]